jgi:hypothetical protein
MALSMATMRWVRRRAKGIARYAVLAAIGQPMAKADHHRVTKSFRQPILKSVNAPLRTKTTMAVSFAKPQVRQAAVDVIGVETGDLHRFSDKRAAWVFLAFGAAPQPPPIEIRLWPDRCQLLLRANNFSTSSV